LRAGARVDYVRRMSLSSQDLRRVPLLSDLREKELSRLANILKERRIDAGRPIIVEGGGGIAFFMMLDGRATVRVGEEVRAELGPGDFFGEQALLDDGAPRSAAIVAETDVRCLGMSAWEFPSFVRDHPPIAWKLLQTLAARLREGREREGRLRAAGTTTAPA
jgi:CRP/FNR family transcriptional regulator